MIDYPKKLYYSISEVADITGVKAHVLRYWETEFPTLRPKKTRAGSRRYRQADIDAVLAIKELLYDRGYKIAGARKALRQEKAVEAAAPAGAVADAPAQIDLEFAREATAAQLAGLRSELEAILAMVRELAPDKAVPLKKMEGQG